MGTRPLARRARAARRSPPSAAHRLLWRRPGSLPGSRRFAALPSVTSCCRVEPRSASALDVSPRDTRRHGGAVFEHGRRQLWHDRDWLWRMTDMRGVRLDQMRQLNDLHRWRRSMTVQGRPVSLARNYVLFMPEGRGTFVAADPPIVAHVTSNGRPETWVRTSFTRRLRAVVLGNSQTGREGLRTRDQQQAHPETRLLVDPGTLVGELDAMCANYGLTPRARPRTTRPASGTRSR